MLLSFFFFWVKCSKTIERIFKKYTQDRTNFYNTVLIFYEAYFLKKLLSFCKKKNGITFALLQKCSKNFQPCLLFPIYKKREIYNTVINEIENFLFLSLFGKFNFLVFSTFYLRKKWEFYRFFMYINFYFSLFKKKFCL